jgi:hypothetical protein
LKKCGTGMSWAAPLCAAGMNDSPNSDRTCRGASECRRRWLPAGGGSVEGED